MKMSVILVFKRRESSYHLPCGPLPPREPFGPWSPVGPLGPWSPAAPCFPLRPAGPL